MKPSQLKALLTSLKKSKSRRAILVESSPGIGKTQIAAQAAAELEIGFKAIHAPLLQPEDYGMPVVIGVKKDELKFVVSTEKFPLEGSDCPEEGIFLIDELAQADSSAQKVLANLVQEREIHGKRLKPGWMIVTTGNHMKDRAGANRILGHLANRLTRIELEPDLDCWREWAIENEIPMEVVSFIGFRPNLLSNYDAKNEVNATPRAWAEGVGERLGIVPKELEFSVFRGDVGEGPAGEFLAYLKIFRNLPNPDNIFLNPKKVEVPKDASTQYAICGALVARVTEVNFGRALEYIKRLPPEFTALFARDSLLKCEDIAHTKEFIQWASKEGADLLS